MDKDFCRVLRKAAVTNLGRFKGFDHQLLNENDIQIIAEFYWDMALNSNIYFETLVPVDKVAARIIYAIKQKVVPRPQGFRVVNIKTRKRGDTRILNWRGEGPKPDEDILLIGGLYPDAQGSLGPVRASLISKEIRKCRANVSGMIKYSFPVV